MDLRALIDLWDQIRSAGSAESLCSTSWTSCQIAQVGWCECSTIKAVARVRAVTGLMVECTS